MDDILIVEDDRALSQGIRLGLEGEGRRFIQASTLAQGERALEERTFSLVVLDLNLPDGSGLELLRRLELPEHMSANALLAVLNGCYSRQEAEAILLTIQENKSL